MGDFFQGYHKETWRQWGNFNWPVTFVFDQSDNPQWRAALDEVFFAFKAKDLRIRELVLADKKVEPHLPLQAADMLAYRIRQVGDSLENQTFQIAELDRLLLRNLIRQAEAEVQTTTGQKNWQFKVE